MDCKFQVGDKVALLFGHLAFNDIKSFETQPKHGVVYTVREILEGCCSMLGEAGIGIKLVEIVNPERMLRFGLAEVAFDFRAFRKVDDDEIRLLRRIKAPLPSVRERNPETV